MADDKISVEFDKQDLENIFKDAGVDFPENPSADDIKSALLTKKEPVSTPASNEVIEQPQKQESKADEAKKELDPDNKGAAQAQEQVPMEDIEFNGKNVLVVDDLGVVNYQLSCLLKRAGFHVKTTTEIMTAIDFFKTKRVDVAILDLYLPSEREGIMLLEEICKIRQSINKECKIIMMSSGLKPELKAACKSLGANNFIEKYQGWHEKIVEACS